MSGRFLKKIRGPFLILLGLMFLGAGGCTGKEEAATQEAPEERVAVEVIEVQPTELQDILVLPGAAEPGMDVTVASDLGGVVESVEFKEGDEVKKGDLLAQIDVAALKAALEMAKADLDLAQRVFSRRQKLYEKEIISKEELDQARTSLVVKQNQVEQAKVQYEKGFIHSPLDGRVNVLHVDEGEFVGGGAPVMDIVNIDRLEIELNVPELDVRYLKVGQQTLVRMDAFPDKVVMGRISFIAFKADTSTRTFRTKVELDNANGLVRPGMIGRVALIRRTIPDAVAAPLFSVVDKEGERLVFVEEDGVAKSRVIDYGVIEGSRIQITKGLKAGDRLIVTGQHTVEDGTLVTAELKPAESYGSIMPGWLPSGMEGSVDAAPEKEPESKADKPEAAPDEENGEKATQ